MKKLIMIGLLVGLVGWAVAATKPMNVIFILADDLGWSDTTLYGTTRLYKTPNIERLAKRGITFTRAYAASPLCSPTRSSILSGRSPARTGLTAPECHLPRVRLEPTVNENAAPGRKDTQVLSVSRLDTALPTLGKLIKADGYSTAHFGKWHLGPEPYSPLEHGFDVDIPHWPGPGPAGSFVAPWRFPTFKANYPKEHIEDRMAEEAIKWMKSVKGKKPFFMNYWQFSVHAPFDAKQELIEKYRKEIDPDDPQRSPTYAAMVHSLDDAVGALLDAVDAAGMAERTAIIFISDNGGNRYSEVDGTCPTSNFPLRGGKATMFEGGVRVPCTVIWPGVTKPGTRSDEVIQTTDFYPTLLNLLGIPLPDDYSIDGIDITPALRGGGLNRDAIFTYFPHSPPIVPDWLPSSMSVHRGNWKLIRLFYQGDHGAHDYLLYNLKDDLGEKKNLASAYPEKVQAMDQLIENYIHDAGVVIPLPNPSFNPKYYIPENVGVPKDQQKVIGSVDGWVASGTCMIERGDGALVVDSSGGDPYFNLTKLKPRDGGPFVFRVRMKSTASGNAVVYYNKPAAAARTVPFSIMQDGQWHEHQAQIPVETLNGLRFDPATGVGRIDIDWIRLEDSSGNLIQEWEF